MCFKEAVSVNFNSERTRLLKKWKAQYLFKRLLMVISGASYGVFFYNCFRLTKFEPKHEPCFKMEDPMLN